MFEYKFIYFDSTVYSKTGFPDDLSTRINSFAQEGWELDKILPRKGNGYIVFGIGYFQKEIGQLVVLKRVRDRL